MRACPRLVACCSVAALTACGSSSADRPRVDPLTRAIPPIVRRACRDAAREVGIRVVCPRLVPRSRYVHYPGLWGAIVDSHRLWLVTFNNGDNGPGYVHWIAGEGNRDDIRYYMLGDEQNVVRGLPRLVATKTVDRRTLLGYRFPSYPAGGPDGGHAAAFVSCGPMLVFASVHGYEHLSLAERMAVDLADRARCAPDAPVADEHARVMAAPPAVTGACDRVEHALARAHARWRSVCPPLVPWSRNATIQYVGGVLSTRGLRRGYLIDGDSTRPFTHWTFASGDPAAVHRGLALRDAFGQPVLAVTRRTATIRGQGVSTYPVAPGGMAELSGHVAIEWKWHGQAYQVSVHRRWGDRQARKQATEMAAAVIGYLRHARLQVRVTRPYRPR